MDIDLIQSELANMKNKNKIKKKSYLKNSKITPKKYHNLHVLTLINIMKYIKL